MMQRQQIRSFKAISNNPGYQHRLSRKYEMDKMQIAGSASWGITSLNNNKMNFSSGSRGNMRRKSSDIDFPHWAAQPTPPPPAPWVQQWPRDYRHYITHSTQTKPLHRLFPWQQICGGCRGRDDQIRGDSQLWPGPLAAWLGASLLTLSCPLRSGTRNKELDPPALLVFEI